MVAACSFVRSDDAPTQCSNFSEEPTVTQEYENVIQWVYASKNEQQLKERYDQWAATYEEELDRDIGCMARYVPLSQPLDT